MPSQQSPEHWIRRLRKYLLADLSLSPRTIDLYEPLIRVFLSYLGERNISLNVATEVDLKNYLQWQQRRCRQVSPSRANARQTAPPNSNHAAVALESCDAPRRSHNSAVGARGMATGVEPVAGCEYFQAVPGKPSVQPRCGDDGRCCSES